MPPARRSACDFRPGNADANNIADHLAVLDQAIGQLSAEIAVGHRIGDDPALVRRQVQVRSLVRWFQQLCLTGPLAVVEPKTLRWGLWHTPARLVRRARRQIVRILDGWPRTPRAPRRLPTRRRSHLTDPESPPTAPS